MFISSSIHLSDLSIYLSNYVCAELQTNVNIMYIYIYILLFHFPCGIYHNKIYSVPTCHAMFQFACVWFLSETKVKLRNWRSVI